jgi:hypothetical protein
MEKPPRPRQPRPQSSAARPGDVVCVFSNGGFGGIHGKLLERRAAGG